jgi:hypothetical protein
MITRRPRHVLSGKGRCRAGYRLTDILKRQRQAYLLETLERR